jgi:hypothetical protein
LGKVWATDIIPTNRKILTPYATEIEKQMHEMYDRLSEKDKRLYAGVEALKLPYGGVSYIAELFGCSRTTVMRGIIGRKQANS